jgi:hypothetical protein
MRKLLCDLINTDWVAFLIDQGPLVSVHLAMLGSEAVYGRGLLSVVDIVMITSVMGVLGPSLISGETLHAVYLLSEDYDQDRDQDAGNRGVEECADHGKEKNGSSYKRL